MDTARLDQTPFPTVTLNDGKSYTVRFTAGAIIEMMESGISLEDLKPQMISGFAALKKICTMLRAGISHDPQHRHLTDLDVRHLIDFEQIPAVSVAVNEALGKAAAQMTKAKESATIAPVPN